MVGSGHELECHLRWPDTLLRIQGHDIRVQFHVLHLCEADLVLGVEWLKSLGPVLTDYNELTMKFTHDGRIVELKGDHNNGVGSISVHQLRCLVQTNKVSEFFHLWVESPSTQILQSPPIRVEVEHIIHQFDELFWAPTTLPPTRTINHAINLHPNSESVIVLPYRYFHFQKQEIELQVEEMLRNGIIRPSTSPFSSPVLLARKRDGSYRFCVDYRAFNAIIIKKRFSIPIVDELLDELGGA